MSADGSQLETGPDEYTLPIVIKEGYSCAARSSLCVVYLSEGYIGIVHVENVTLDPKPRADEITVAPVVRVTSNGLTICENSLAIIELMKTVELSDKSQYELIPCTIQSRYPTEKPMMDRIASQ